MYLGKVHAFLIRFPHSLSILVEVYVCSYVTADLSHTTSLVRQTIGKTILAERNGTVKVEFLSSRNRREKEDNIKEIQSFQQRSLPDV